MRECEDRSTRPVDDFPANGNGPRRAFAPSRCPGVCFSDGTVKSVGPLWGTHVASRIENRVPVELVNLNQADLPVAQNDMLIAYNSQSMPRRSNSSGPIGHPDSAILFFSKPKLFSFWRQTQGETCVGF
jgi:hypothetical protein